MHMQEPGQQQLFDETGTTDQEYGAYRAETGYHEQGQKVSPRDRLGSVSGTLTIFFSSIGFAAATFGIIGSAMILSHTGGSSYLLTGGILGLIGSLVALLLFVTIFTLSVVSAARRATRYRRPRSRFGQTPSFS